MYGANYLGQLANASPLDGIAALDKLGGVEESQVNGDSSLDGVVVVVAVATTADRDSPVTTALNSAQRLDGAGDMLGGERLNNAEGLKPAVLGRVVSGNTIGVFSVRREDNNVLQAGTDEGITLRVMFSRGTLKLCM